MTFLNSWWCAATSCANISKGRLGRCDPFSLNSSQFLPFPCQFDELLSTDHPVTDKNREKIVKQKRRDFEIVGNWMLLLCYELAMRVGWTYNHRAEDSPVDEATFAWLGRKQTHVTEICVVNLEMGMPRRPWNWFICMLTTLLGDAFLQVGYPVLASLVHNHVIIQRVEVWVVAMIGSLGSH